MIRRKGYLAQNAPVGLCCQRIGGSVVECSPATRAARVRFPADASFRLFPLDLEACVST